MSTIAEVYEQLHQEGYDLATRTTIQGITSANCILKKDSQYFLLKVSDVPIIKQEIEIPLTPKVYKHHDNWKLLDFVPGINLYDLVQASVAEHRTIASSHKLGILYSLAFALNELHKKNFVHRDLTPLNVVVDGKHVSHIIGLNNCGVLDETGRRKSVNLHGQVNYMSIEALNKDTSTKTDIYAFGGILFYVLYYSELYTDLLLSDEGIRKYCQKLGDVTLADRVIENNPKDLQPHQMVVRAKPIIEQVIKRGIKDDRFDEFQLGEIDTELLHLMRLCFAEEKDRPTAENLMNEIDRIATKLNNTEDADQYKVIRDVCTFFPDGPFGTKDFVQYAVDSGFDLHYQTIKDLAVDLNIKLSDPPVIQPLTTAEDKKEEEKESEEKQNEEKKDEQPQQPVAIEPQGTLEQQ